MIEEACFFLFLDILLSFYWTFLLCGKKKKLDCGAFLYSVFLFCNQFFFDFLLLQRNFFVEAGANRSPCSNIYAGRAAFSEPEVVGLRDFIEKISDLKVYISLHSYGQLFLSPWGFTNEKPYNYLDQVL